MAIPYFVAEIVTFVLPFAVLAILSLALNLHWGHTGLFNAGIAGFYAIGAYTAAILLTPNSPATQIYPGHIGGFDLGENLAALLSLPTSVSYVLAFLVAAAAAFFVALIVGLLIGLPTLKLRADYLAIATLALAEMFRVFIMNARPWTAGTIGIVSIPRPFDGLGLTGRENDALLALMFVVLVAVTFFILWWMTKAPWGRVLRAIRDDEEAASVLGKDTFWLKLQAFSIGCGVMGAAGALLAVLNRVIVPTLFVPFTTFSVYVAVILGGSGNNKGVVIGAGIFFMFYWASIRLKDFLPIELATNIAFYRLIAIGVLLIILVIFRPQGILPEEKYVPEVG